MPVSIAALIEAKRCRLGVVHRGVDTATRKRASTSQRRGNEGDKSAAASPRATEPMMPPAAVVPVPVPRRPGPVGCGRGRRRGERWSDGTVGEPGGRTLRAELDVGDRIQINDIDGTITALRPAVAVVDTGTERTIVPLAVLLRQPFHLTPEGSDT